jgi:hypothetical protein
MDCFRLITLPWQNVNQALLQQPPFLILSDKPGSASFLPLLFRQAKAFESTRPWNRLALAPLLMAYLLVATNAKTSAAGASHRLRSPLPTEKSVLHTRQSS